MQHTAWFDFLVPTFGSNFTIKALHRCLPLFALPRATWLHQRLEMRRFSYCVSLLLPLVRWHRCCTCCDFLTPTSFILVHFSVWIRHLMRVHIQDPHPVVRCMHLPTLADEKFAKGAFEFFSCSSNLIFLWCHPGASLFLMKKTWQQTKSSRKKYEGALIYCYVLFWSISVAR